MNTQSIGKNVILKENCVIGENVTIEDDVFVDYGTIIRDNVTIKRGTKIGANCIVGEYLMDFYKFSDEHAYHPTIIGEESIIRSNTIIYGDVTIMDHFQTGHHVTIREKTKIGSHVSVGTLSDIQGFCEIGSYVRMHSNVHIGQKSVIDDYVWLFPYVVLTNDPTPPSDIMVGVKINKYAVIATGSLLMPGVEIGEDALIGAGTIVTKDVPKYAVVLGSPGKVVKDVHDIKSHVTGESIYPWRYHFGRNMPWEDIGFEKWSCDNNKEE